MGPFPSEGFAFDLPIELSATGAKIPVSLTNHVTKEQLLGFPPFLVWLTTLRTSLALQKDDTHPFFDNPFQLESITIQSVDFYAPDRIVFVKLHAIIRNSYNDFLPGITFLRLETVAILMIFRPRDARDERWAVITLQPRLSTGSLSFLEIPAEILHEDGSFTGGAAQDIYELTGLKIRDTELIDMTFLVLEEFPNKEGLQTAIYTSPRGSNESVRLLLWEKDLDRQEIEDLKATLKPGEGRGERVEIRLCKYEDLWREGARDPKALGAWALHEALRRSGKLS